MTRARPRTVPLRPTPPAAADVAANAPETGQGDPDDDLDSNGVTPESDGSARAPRTARSRKAAPQRVGEEG